MTMGCDTSKAEAVEDTEKQENGEEFTENQIDSIKSTWPLLLKNTDTTGTKLFRLIFQTEPRIRQLFKKTRNRNAVEDENSDIDDVLGHPAMQEHILQFMQTLGHVVDAIDWDRQACEQTIMLLGAKYGMIEGFREDYFSVYSNCMMDTWESVIGEEFIIEVKESWEVLCQFLTRFMREGFIIYQQEVKCNDNQSELVV